MVFIDTYLKEDKDKHRHYFSLSKKLLMQRCHFEMIFFPPQSPSSSRVPWWAKVLWMLSGLVPILLYHELSL